jgi:hypothetical protein
MTIELLAPLMIRLNGQDRDCRVGDTLSLPETQAHRLLRKAPGLVRRVDSAPASPLQPGWLVVYRDQRGALCGGCDDRHHGTVKECRWAGATWTVHLTDGQRIPLAMIRSVGQTDEAGQIVAAWTVKEHGADGQGSVEGGRLRAER